MTSHADGSYVVWKTSDGSQPKEVATTPYGKKNLLVLCCLCCLMKLGYFFSFSHAFIY